LKVWPGLSPVLRNEKPDSRLVTRSLSFGDATEEMQLHQSGGYGELVCRSVNGVVELDEVVDEEW
jgi:hypothetical protein